MAPPTLITLPSPSPLGLTILPRTACHDLRGCGSGVPPDKLPLIIVLAVVVVIIIFAIYWFSFRKLREIRKQQAATTKDDVELAIVLGLNPNIHAPTLGAGTTTTGATAGSGATGTGTGVGTGAGTGAIGARGGAGGAAAGQPGVFEGGLPPLVPPPMYEETPPPPPTYQRGEMAAPRHA